MHGKKYDKWICFDFDGVCTFYNGWKGADVIGEPIPGVAELIEELRDKGYKVTLLTIRKADKKLFLYK